MSFFDDLEPKLSFLDEKQIKLIREAYQIAEKAHEGQLRRSGDPYITHPVAVAGILADMHMDAQSIMAALMHDVIEDSGISKKSIAKQFGEPVAELVDGVSKLTQIHFATRAEAQARNFCKMLLAMVKDIRVILIKLADRLHNMRTIMNMPPKKRRRIARETLEIYAPIANRLGMHSFRTEFEDLGFSALYPLRHKILQLAVKRARGNRKEIIQTIKQKIKQKLVDQYVSYIKVTGRQKHIYSIYKKMKMKHASFSEIMDVYGFRILVEKNDDCYRALGAVHNLYKPLPERFKDYVAIPKTNGYQSLHTTLFGPYGVPIEIQIRTEAMNIVAEKGIAAHWLYKSSELAIDDAQIKTREWLTGLLELQQNTGSSLEFIENVKIDLFPDEIYVFTPKGDIIELSRGATPVDFAYAIHSDVGNSCVAAKVDRRFAPLSVPLSNGQTVEIVTAPGTRPNPAWLNFVATAKARSNIRHFLKTQKREESITLGKQLLDHALRDYSSKLKSVSEPHWQKMLEEFNLKNLEELFEAIGVGNFMSHIVAQRILEEQQDTENNKPTRKHPLIVTGTEGMVLTFSECCRPIPGDPITGYVESGLGIIVHNDQCKKLSHLRKTPEKLIPMRWEENITAEFKSDILVEVLNERWVLAEIASVIAESEGDIDNINVEHRFDQHVRLMFTISVKNKNHLEHVMKRILSVKSVEKVMRHPIFGEIQK